MKTRILTTIGILMFSCAAFSGLFPGSREPVRAQGPTTPDLTIDRNSEMETTIRTLKGTRNVKVAEITFTNQRDMQVEIDLPRFYAMSDEADFKLQDNIEGAHFYYLNEDTPTDASRSDIDDHHLTFNTGLVVAPLSTATAVLTIDIAADAPVQALAFDLDFTSPNFVIRFSDYGKGGDRVYTLTDELAPFQLTGNFVRVHFGDTTTCPELEYSLTRGEYDRYLRSLNQNNGYGGLLYSPYIPEGGMIRARGDIDIYIVKYSHGKRFKRLILSPSVFKSYGHLKWEDVIDVPRAVLDSYATSDYVFVAGDSAIWRLEPKGDMGTRRHFLAPAVASWGYDPDGTYEINATDRNSYVLGPDIQS